MMTYKASTMKLKSLIFFVRKLNRKSMTIEFIKKN